MLTIKIKTDNDAFQNDNLELEIERCLNDVIQLINGYGHKEGDIHDTNGNNVGHFKLTNK